MKSQIRGKPSFFDVENCTQRKIWEPLRRRPEGVIFDSNVKKATKEHGKLKDIRLLLTEEYIFLMKNDDLKAQLNLVLTRLDVINEPPNGFRLTRNQCTVEFFFDDVNLFKSWKNELIYKCFQSTFHEEFLVSKMIGKGSFAKVYLATKKETNVEYAIKAFNKEFMLEQFKGKESLENEIKVMRRFNQESLVHLYEVYETVNSIYFVIDILRGGELLNRVKQKGQIHQSDLQKLMYNFTKALAYIHQKNCVHRDLKPENLLLKSKDNDNDVVIADFGLAAFLDEEIIFKRCGTPGFVAPEILNYKDGEKFYDQKCDVFSAGIIFYVLLTGKQPFQGADYKIILRANKACEINFSLPQIVNVILQYLYKSPPALQDILKKMLLSDPLKRPSSSECLKHEYFAKVAQEVIIPNFQSTQENLIMYEKDYLYGLSKKVQDSQEFVVGSMELQSRSPGMNGKVDTVGSLSNYSNSSIPKFNDVKAPGASKFSQFSQKQIQVQGSLTQEASSPSNRISKNSDDLHKKALKNSLFNKHQEEVKRAEEETVNDENPGLSQAMNKIKEKEGHVKLFKSFSPACSPRNADR